MISDIILMSIIWIKVVVNMGINITWLWTTKAYDICFYRPYFRSVFRKKHLITKSDRSSQ